MDGRRRARPSPALVVGVVALVAALAGTAVAGPSATTSVSKKKTKQIANKQAKKQIGKAMPFGAEDLSETATEEQSTTINNGQQADLTATCNEDQKLLSGGARFNDAPLNFNNLDIQASYKVDNGWRAIFNNRSNTNNRTVTVYAYCLTG